MNKVMEALDWIEGNIGPNFVDLDIDVRIHDTDEEWTVKAIYVNNESIMYLDDDGEVEKHPLTYVNGMDLIEIKNRLKNKLSC